MGGAELLCGAQAPMWFFHQKLHNSIFGSAPGLKHRPGGSNRNYFKEA